MLERETVQADAPQPVPRAMVATEPATARALWPTFMRRTLSEETLRHAPADAAGK
jgi:hypothetical protein